MLKNTYVFIDEGYLSKISKHFGDGQYLKFSKICFANKLTKDCDLWCKKIFYYTAPPYQSPKPTDDENRRRQGYDKFVSNMTSKYPNFIIREGRCQKGDGDYHQKGVDILLTMDLASVSQSKEVDTIMLLACDTDFVPIINRIRKEFGVRVILIYYTDRKRDSNFSMSNYLWSVCDEKILLTKEHFERCIRKD